MNLKHWNEVVKAQRPSLSKVTTELMSYTALVKGAAILASVWERLSPTSACLSAPQSLAPSPTMPTSVLQKCCSFSISLVLSSGDILAYIWAFNNTYLNTAYYLGSCRRWLKALPVIAIEYSSGGCYQGKSYKAITSLIDLSFSNSWDDKSKEFFFAGETTFSSSSRSKVPTFSFWALYSPRVLLHYTTSKPALVFIMSPRKTSWSGSIRLHSLPTEIAVSTLSPVAMMVLIFALLSVSITPIVTGLSLFCIIRKPRKVRSFSTCSLGIFCDLM